MEIFLQIGCKGNTKFLVNSKMVDSFYQLPTIIMSLDLEPNPAKGCQLSVQQHVDKSRHISDGYVGVMVHIGIHSAE